MDVGSDRTVDFGAGNVEQRTCFAFGHLGGFGAVHYIVRQTGQIAGNSLWWTKSFKWFYDSHNSCFYQI
jgi:hypothetical protein